MLGKLGEKSNEIIGSWYTFTIIKYINLVGLKQK